MSYKILFIIFSCIFLLLGCSNPGKDPIQPKSDDTNFIRYQENSKRHILGEYLISLDLYSGQATVITNRTLQAHEEYYFYDTDDVGIDVDYDDTTIEDEYPTDYDYHFWTWRCNITLENKTQNTFYDVRGIVDTNASTIGVRNADARTSIWHTPFNNESLENPFKYFGNITSNESETEEYFLNWAPVPYTLSCQGPQPIPSPAAVEFILIVDACDSACEDPYAIENFSHTLIDLTQSQTVTFSVNVLDHQNDIDAVKLYWDGFIPYGYVDFTLDTGNTWSYSDEFGGYPNERVDQAYIIATSSEPDPSDDYEDPNYIRKDVLIKIGDIDDMVDQLFSTVISSEIDTILDDWDERDHTSSWAGGPIDSFEDKDVNNGGDYPVGETGTYHLINHTIRDHESENIGLHWGAVRIPDCIPPAGGWPVIVYCHYGNCIKPDTSHSESLMGIPLDSSCDYRNRFIELFPSYRGNALCFDGDSFISSFENSPADWDVDDIITFVERVLDDEFFSEKIDPDRICLVGGSRGGSPAYLAKIRDPYNRFSAALIFCGSVTSFFPISEYPNTSYIEEQTRIYANDLFYGYTETGPHYKKPYNECHNIMTQIIDEIYAGTMSIEEARFLMFRSSPFFFTTETNLDLIQVNHGVIDGYVNSIQSFILYDEYNMTADEVIGYDEQYHAIIDSASGSNSVTYIQNLKNFYDEVTG